MFVQRESILSKNTIWLCLEINTKGNVLYQNPLLCDYFEVVSLRVFIHFFTNQIIRVACKNMKYKTATYEWSFENIITFRSFLNFI
jgi:hypothetical protein